MKRREFLRKAAAGVAGSTAAATLGACTMGVPTTGGQVSAAAASTAADTAAASGTASTAAEASVAASTAAGAVSEAAGAQAPMQNSDMPALEWRMATSWPASLDIIYGGVNTIADRVSSMTDGRFKITPSAAGELVPGLQVLDAVQAGTVEMGHTASYYYVGKSPVFAFGTTLPFGLSAQQQNAWLYSGGGLQQLQEFYTQYNVIQFPAGNTGVQMGGWFRKELTGLADLQGLKMRIPGLGGQVMAKLGVSVQTLAAPEIYPALETGAIDATKWVGPYDDLKLGFNKVAQYYYAPGWWEPGSTLEVQINLERWNELPKLYQELITAAAYQANIEMLSSFEAKNGEALNQLLAAGAQLRTYPQDIMEAAERESLALYDGFAAQDAAFKTIYDGWRAFRDQIYAWSKANEFAYNSFVYG